MLRQSLLKSISVLVIVALIWAVEQFLVQGATLIPDMAINDLRQFKRETVRFLINSCFALILVCVFPKKVIYILFGISCLIDCGLIAYFNYFHQPLSLFTLTAHASESVQVLGAFADYFPINTFMLLVVSLGLKISFLSKVNRKQEGISKGFKYIATVACVLYLMIVLPLTMIFRPMNQLKSWKSTSWFGGLYGYFITWIGESYYLGSSEALLQYANGVANPKRNSLPSPLSKLDFTAKNHIVVIQCESLSYWASQFIEEDGGYLMPFLAQLRSQSISLRIEPIHKVGSSDADFCFLNTKFPNGKVSPYKVPGFDYDHALPFLTKKKGFTSLFYHGNRGTFFSRRIPCLKMGFDRVLFQEDLESEGLLVSNWGVYDHDVLAHSSQRLSESKHPSFHFLITLTTHSPFDFLPSNHVIKMDSNDGRLFKYFNSMTYLDNCLANYFEKLPFGSWMMLYGDHGPGFRRESAGFTESVPFIVSRKGYDLELDESQQEQINPSVRQFDLLDMSRYFREKLSE